MALKITRAADPITVDRLNLVLYAAPGLGKTSLAFTAEAPLLLDFDGGAYRAANRKDTVPISAWADAANIEAADLEGYATVIIDTAGRALDWLTADIIKTEPKGHKNGALTLPGYGLLRTRFTTFLKRLNALGKDVVLIAHMDEQRNGDEVIERLDVQGSSKGEIYKAADAMGRLVIKDGQRWLLFSPTDAAFGKNPAQLDPLPVPAPSAPEFGTFLADVIAQTKARLNELTEAQRHTVAEQDWFRETLPKVDGADGVNGLLDRAKAAGPVCKKMLADRAKVLGLTFDASQGEYAAPAPVEAKEPA